MSRKKLLKPLMSPRSSYCPMSSERTARRSRATIACFLSEVTLRTAYGISGCTAIPFDEVLELNYRGKERVRTIFALSVQGVVVHTRTSTKDSSERSSHSLGLVVPFVSRTKAKYTEVDT